MMKRTRRSILACFLVVSVMLSQMTLGVFAADFDDGGSSEPASSSESGNTGSEGGGSNSDGGSDADEPSDDNGDNAEPSDDNGDDAEPSDDDANTDGDDANTDGGDANADGEEPGSDGEAPVTTEATEEEGPSGIALFADEIMPILANAIDNYDNLVDAINAAQSGDTIEIANNIILKDIIEIPAGKDITIRSDSNGPWTLTQKNGRHFNVNEQNAATTADLTLENIILDGADTSGGVYVWAHGTLNLKSGAVITNCLQKSLGGEHGGGVMINKDGTLNMYDGAEISFCEAVMGGGVFVIGQNGNTGFAMTGGTISNCTAAKNGGGVYLSNIGSKDEPAIINGKILNCAAKIGGGVFMENSIASMSNSALIDTCNIGQNSPGNGGGIYMINASEITLDGAVISNCMADCGGGIYMGQNNKVTLKNGAKIERCMASANSAGGGGVAAYDGSTVTLESGAMITKCNAESGGGILAGKVSVTLDNSSITECTARGSWGGGIYAYNSGSLTMKNGATITDCHADGNNGRGGGVNSNTGTKLIMKSGTSIKNCTALFGGGIATGRDDVYNNLDIADGVTFTGNSAKDLYKASETDWNAVKDNYIKSSSNSVNANGIDNPLNNYDINYSNSDGPVTPPPPPPGPGPGPGPGGGETPKKPGTTDPGTDIPGTEIPLTPGPDTGLDLPDGEIPLAQLPGGDAEDGTGKEDGTDIEDEGVPLGEVPKTGDAGMRGLLTAMLLSSGLGALLAARKKKEDQ